MQPQPGQLIRAAFLSVPAEVKKFEPRSGYYLLEAVLEERKIKQYGKYRTPRLVFDALDWVFWK